MTSGDVLEGRYRILDVVAEGGMGTVYRAEHTLIKRKLAVKVLHPELAVDRANVERFMQEALAAGTLGHPHIVEATDMGFVGELPFIVFEFLEGCILTEEIYRVRGLSVRRALEIALQIASALDAAHGAGIVHLDLKCDNVIVTDRETSDHVKVIDFGISRFMAADVDTTKPVLMMGTPEFMAPEQVTDPASVDRRTDIYALGVCLYEMLSARRPFTGEPRTLLHRVVHESPPELEESIPTELRFAIRKMLAKAPEARYQSMDDVIEALQGIARAHRDDVVASSSMSIATIAPPATPTYPPAPRRRIGKVAVFAALVLGAGGAGAAAWLTRETPAVTSPALAVAATPVAIARANPDRVLAAIDVARERAAASAASPVLRAAIETDAATVTDLVQTEDMFVLRPGEVVEVYRGDVLLTRAPADALPLRPGATRVTIEGKRVEVTVPVRGSRGSLVFAMPIAAEAMAGLSRDQLALAVHAADPAIVID